MPEPTIDAQRVDHARREISRLVSEIERLADLELSPSEFYVEIVRRANLASAAEASALWIVNAQGLLQPVAQVNLAQTKVRIDDELAAGHEALLRHVVETGKPAVLPPAAMVSDSQGAAANPSPYLLLLAPVAVEGVLNGVFELFIDSKRTAASLGLLKLAEKTADETARFARNRRFKQVAGREKTWNDLDTFIRSVHSGLNPKQVAYLLANDGRRLIGVERVSVAVKRGERCRIEAVSGQDTVERRSNLIRTMNRLAQTVLKHGEAMTYTGSVDPDWPRDVARALSNYIEESNSRLVIVTPLYDRRKDGKKVGKPKAALVIETIADAVEPEELAGRIDVVSRHGSLAFYNAEEVSRIFLLPLWKGLGWVSRLFTGSRLAMTSTILGIIAATAITLTFLPWTLWLEGKGALYPEIRRTVFAPIQGEVEQVKTDFRTNVQVGSELLVLTNPQLKDEALNLRGELNSKLLRRSSLQAAINERGRSAADVQRDKRDLAELSTEIEGVQNRLRLVDDQLDKLKLRSPIEGQVLTWQPALKLQNRPVERGEPLLEVARTEGEWIVEVDFPENTVAHLQRARAKSENGELPVAFVVSSAPNTTYTGVLYDLATQAEPKNGENVCAGKVRLDRRLPVDLRLAGAEVRVKVDCGMQPLGYVLFRELIDFAREKVFF
jgi:hypothetical protein